MRSLVTKQFSNKDSTHQKPVRGTPTPVVRSLSTGLTGSAMLQRKPSCAWGGGCPRCSASNQLMRQVTDPTRVHLPRTPQPAQTPSFLRVFRWPQLRNTGRSICETGVE
jgi:hypothetical protein